jgi:adenosylmethionine-8-amino-7-oxononanoate aminotransferase
VLCREEIFRAFYDTNTRKGFLHSHSYTGNPLACRAALATLDIFEEDDVLTANRERAKLLERLLEEAFSGHPAVRHLRQRGTIAAFDVEGATDGFSRRFFVAALEAGALLRPIGGTVYFMPPYVMSEPELRALVAAAAAALDRALA